MGLIHTLPAHRGGFRPATRDHHQARHPDAAPPAPAVAPRESADLGFRLLGPLEIEAEGDTVELPSYRQRAVLAAMLLDANSVVAVDRLVEAVWEDDPPPTAHKQIQMCVSQLRRLFESLGHDTLIHTRPGGYQLSLDDESVDFHRFERLRDRARGAAHDERTGEAARVFQQALQAWRGSALAGFHSRFLQSRGTWLDELRWSTYEEYVELRLRTGHASELVGELTVAVADQPTRERLSAYLILALYQSGRRADALETYLATREVLVSLLGIEPGHGLRRLHAAVLADDERRAAALLRERLIA
ncbi:AfsR/SARP family transcriptional regulator [Sphaerisporangium aureirubrum]|uniref:BTAD domain-containing putative transcriptional regulator n=1 Tax=Sphaerisporangium aureirubrum TaxID=1544736 RepID=A0ABW1NCT5_9ACTN